jgi:hypothetical protein
MISPPQLRFCLIPGFCVIAAGCAAGDAEIKERADIERCARITISASARNIRCATDAVHRGPNVATYGRFDFPISDLPLVLARMPAGEKTVPYDNYSNVTSHAMNQPWWQPDQLTRKRVANWSMPGYSVNLLF